MMEPVVTVSGKLKFNMGDGIDVPKSFSSLNSTNGGEKVFKLELLRPPLETDGLRMLSEDSPYAFDWEMTGKNNEVQMQFKFKNPELISKEGVDKVRVSVIDQDYFASNGDKAINF